MAGTTDFLMTVQGMAKLHDDMIKMICGKYQLTLIEGKIISFLHNNPGKDTAGDIVELRKLSKGNVSLAVESLIGKNCAKESRIIRIGERSICRCWHRQNRSRT